MATRRLVRCCDDEPPRKRQRRSCRDKPKFDFVRRLPECDSGDDEPLDRQADDDEDDESLKDFIVGDDTHIWTEKASKFKPCVTAHEAIAMLLDNQKAPWIDRLADIDEFQKMDPHNATTMKCKVCLKQRVISWHVWLDDGREFELGSACATRLACAFALHDEESSKLIEEALELLAMEHDAPAANDPARFLWGTDVI